MSGLGTGSELHRIALCAGAAALPRVKNADASPAAARGTAIHEYLATVGELGRDEALARAPEEWRPACELIELDKLPQIDPKAYAHELSMAFDVATGKARLIGIGTPREVAYAGLGDTEFGATVDLAALTADGRGIFHGDFKSGRADVPAARSNLQLMLGALALARYYQRDYASVAIIRLHEDGHPWFDRAEFDDFGLDAIELELRRIANRILAARDVAAAGGEPPVQEGAHCKYCESYLRCPAKLSLIQQLGAAPHMVANAGMEDMNHGRVRDAIVKLRLAKDVIDRAYQQARAYAIVHPIDMGDGVVFGARESRSRVVDGAVARTVLRDLYGPEVADSACTWDSSISAIGEALKRVAQQRGVDGKLAPLAPIKREALAAIEAAGGVQTRVSVKVESHRPAKTEPAAALPVAAGTAA